jgi:hypothetical protein
MIKLDDDLLNELGLGSLSPDDKKKMLAHVYETLEMRVGMKLAERMSDAQLDEFEQFINTNDEQGALHWLEANFPDYKDVVAEEFEKLKGEIKAIAPQILASSAQQAQQPAMPAQPSVDPYAQQMQQPAMPYPNPPMPPAYPSQQTPPPVNGNHDDYNLAA